MYFRFMSEGGWALTNSWLADAIEARNWPLMQELLELLLMCPVDVERLKLNNCPKLVKGLSKDSTDQSKFLVLQHITGLKFNSRFSVECVQSVPNTILFFADVQLLASRLVAQWLQIVKGPSLIPQPTIDTHQLALEPHHSVMRDVMPEEHLQILEGMREEDGMPNFSDPSMQLDINSLNTELFAELPSDFETISQEDLLQGNICDLRGDNNSNSTVTSSSNSVGTSEVNSEIESEVVSSLVNEIKHEPTQDVSSDALLQTASVVKNENVKEGIEFMDTDSTIANGEGQEKLVLKLNLKDGRKIAVKSPSKRKLSEDEEESSPAKRKAREQSKDKRRVEKDKQEKEKSDKSSHKHDRLEKADKKSSSSSERKSSKDSSRDSHKSESKSKHYHSDKLKDRSRDKDKDKSKSSSSSSSKDKEREKSKLKDKDKSKIKEKETQAEKDKATLAKIMQPSVSKLGKIPKKTDGSKSSEKVHPPVLPETKKISISIENRKQAGEPRPKTVKTLPTKFRSTGLEEVVKPPPSRKDVKEVKKATSSVGLSLLGPKESPLLSLPVPPSEKRTKPLLNMAGPPERPGAIKLIPAKPKCEYTCLGHGTSTFFFTVLLSYLLKSCFFSKFHLLKITSSTNLILTNAMF